MSDKIEGQDPDEDMNDNNNHSRTEPREFAPWHIRLARLILRDCQVPGDYEILIAIPPQRNRPVQITINKIETISRQTII